MLHKQLTRLANGLAYVAAAILIAVACYTSVDAILRKVAGSGLPGAVDVVGYGLGLVVALGLPYCTLTSGHVSVPLFVRAIPGRAGRIVRTFAPLLAIAFFLVLAWQIGRVAVKRLHSGDQMWMLAVETWPIWIAITVLLGVSALAQAAALTDPNQDQTDDDTATLAGRNAQ